MPAPPWERRARLPGSVTLRVASNTSIMTDLCADLDRRQGSEVGGNHCSSTLHSIQAEIEAVHTSHYRVCTTEVRAREELTVKSYGSLRSR